MEMEEIHYDIIIAGAGPTGLLLANQLALVVVKIKANDAIVELQKETEILQSLNIDFALIREKTDLLNVIHHKLNHFFDFGHHWVATINDDELTMTSFLQDTESNAKNHPKFQKALTHKYPISDGIFNKALLSKDPVVFDLDQLAADVGRPEVTGSGNLALVRDPDPGLAENAVHLQLEERRIGVEG